MVWFVASIFVHTLAGRIPADLGSGERLPWGQAPSPPHVGRREFIVVYMRHGPVVP